jgi:hypothetical protein
MWVGVGRHTISPPKVNWSVINLLLILTTDATD